MINVPKAATQLRSQLPAMHVELCDDLGNLYKSTSVPQLKFSCEKLNVVPAPGESACWQELQLGEHQLQLPALDITPVRERLIFESPNKPNKPVMCSVVLQISGLPDQQGGTHQVTTTFSIGVLPGTPQFVSAAEIGPLQNRRISCSTYVHTLNCGSILTAHGSKHCCQVMLLCKCMTAAFAFRPAPIVCVAHI